MITIGSYEELASWIGKEMGQSGCVTFDQERINKFADATLDHQWIHTDPERCKTESPFGQTIAHGYLSLAVLPYLWNQIVEVHNLERMMNYGLDKLKYAQPVLSGQSIYMKTKMVDCQNLRGAIKTTIHVTMIIKETEKKALEADATFIYFFK
ncbi:MAG: MaoC family dehydratase [Bacteroidaceae bacterium]|jgi:acyl dehydratase|nr:MaoC family dehydratase [Bacteroidaceae bacterium]MBR6819487.1 MaoC family dehydratase [Bacteroidaceae bacterium]MBR7052987.1 MaoC family dehydratase [Bacteroidaceae bacterium]